MPIHDFARAVAQEIDRAGREHVTTVEPTEDPNLPGMASARWHCACGARSEYDYLFPPTAEQKAAEHLSRATRPNVSEADHG